MAYHHTTTARVGRNEWRLFKELVLRKHGKLASALQAEANAALVAHAKRLAAEEGGARD